jgi:hypothetical protein
MSIATIDLQVKERRGDPTGLKIWRFRSGRFESDDAAAGAADIDPLTRRIVPSPDSHGSSACDFGLAIVDETTS